MFKLPNECSIFTTEAIAIAIPEAVKPIINKKHSKYLILSDSLNTLNSNKNKFKPCDIVIKIQYKLYEVSIMNKQITFMWIPGHMGIKGNETVHQQTKNATKHMEITHIHELTYDDIKTHIT